MNKQQDALCLANHANRIEGIIVELEAIEQAIRKALAKADVGNPAIRQKVYESAWGAHERSLAANGALDDEQRDERRERLKDSITRIEKEVQTSGSITLPVPAPVVERREPVLSQSATRIEPTIDVGAESELDAPELTSDGPVAAENYRPDRMRRRLKRNRERKKANGLIKFVIILAILAVALGLLWFVASGIINLKPSSIPPSTSNPAVSGSHEPLKEGELSPEGNWITIFDPSDTTQVSVTGRATATIGGDQVEKYLRIQSPGEADEVSFQVGQGVLEQLAGKNTVFDIVAKSEDGVRTQMAVSCDFGALGDCGRKRFDVSDASSEYLVQKEFPADKKPAAGGAIKINSDITQAGKSVDIISIRVQVAN
ncbi:hypothetical protein [Phyllobacterium zundukense]|uniref:Uncharacterized protein n=1 Tax=Phyllobacterium zundukense TaxID=1867719 RepID=A0ACD4D659_9HYPH|nr:hypothetical protein [Phyllobacterium zundukense]UXN61269.1 hypothetical protein N8E88_14380 [Phyllobacterium zundukense]